MPLTDNECRNARGRDKPYKLSDSKGMHLLVTPAGSRLWYLAYRFEGKQRSLPLGEYPKVKLSEARELREIARGKVAAGVDPMAERKQGAGPRGDTFKALAEEFHDIWKKGKSPAHIERVWSRLERDAFGEIGDRPINQITPQEIIDMVRKVEARGAIDVSKRLKQKCGEVFQYGIATGRCTTDPTTSIGKALQPRPRTRHMPRLPLAELPSFLSKLDDYDGEELTRLAIRFTLLTWARTGEVRFARRGEFEDLDGPAPLWRVPGARMKMNREHLVPLSLQAVAVIRRVLSLHGADYAFPQAGKPQLPMSENTMLFACYRMGYAGRMTIHGLRGMASTWANEAIVPNGDPYMPIRRYHSDWVELALAHADEDRIRAAYNAAEHLHARRQMLADWAGFIDAQKQDEFEALLG